MEKSFARKLNWKPLFNSLVLGAAIGSFTYILADNDITAGIVLGTVAFLIQSTIVYPRYLPSLYGCWKVNDGAVSYYDYNTWTKRIKAIFLPIGKSRNQFRLKISYPTLWLLIKRPIRCYHIILF